MTILHLPESFFPSNGGGKEVYTLRLAQALQARGVANVVVIHGNDESYQTYQYEGIEVRVLPRVIHQTPYVNRYKRLVDEMPGFVDLLDQLKPDIVYFHDQNNGASLAHLRVVKQKGIKSLVTFHTPGQVCPQHALLQAGKTICNGRLDATRCTSCQMQSFFSLPPILATSIALVGRLKASQPVGKIQKLLVHRFMTEHFMTSYREFAELSDKIIVFTPWARQTYLANNIPEQKLAMIDTGGNPSLDLDTSRSYKPGETFEICYLGRCEWIKGIHLLVDAVKELDRSLPVKVYFYSHSWDKTEYGRKLLRAIDGDERFVQPRLVENRLLANTIANHHACVIPSIWPETGPLTVFDAFGSGLPVIGTNSAGIADRVRNNVDGLLFENGSRADLKKNIEQMLRSHDLYNKLRSNIKPNRTMTMVAEDVLELLKTI